MTKECVVCQRDVTQLKPNDSMLFYTMYQSVDVAILRRDNGAKPTQQLRKRGIRYICEKCRSEDRGNWTSFNESDSHNFRPI